jgi:cellulose synthase operon protein C
MIAWATTHATIVPLLAGEQLPPELREHLRTGHSDVLDVLVAAMQAQMLLVTDDLPTRVMSQRFGRCGASWLHQVFRVAVHYHHIDNDTFIRWSADLAAAGHNYLSVTGTAMTRSMQLDARAGEVPGYLFRMLSKSIGGSQAEPLSHVMVCSEFLRALWTDPDAANYRARTTGHLLSQLLRGRSDDYLNMLKGLLYDVRDLPWLVEYIHSWARGHFTPVFPTSE